MKELAILMIAHRDADMINRLTSRLQHPEIDIYIHIDKKSKRLAAKIKRYPNISLLPENECFDVRWGQNQDNRAVFALIDHSVGCYRHYALISGQHYPLQDAESIVEALRKAPDKDFITIMAQDSPNYKDFLGRSVLYWPECMIGRNPLQKALSYIYRNINKLLNYPLRRKTLYLPSGPFLFGSLWWILSGKTINYLQDYVKNNPAILDYYDNSFCSDECIYQTLVNECPNSTVVNDNLTYIDWSEGNASPKLLTQDDFDSLANSKCLFARKFDSTVSKELLDYIDLNLLQVKPYCSPDESRLK